METAIPINPLDRAEPGFLLANARACVEASRLAYDSPATIESETCHVVILERERANFLAFRGTKNFRDFLTDGECVRINGVHLGFYNSFHSVFEPLAKRLGELDKAKPLFITGHSKGGAEAVQAAWNFADLFPRWELHTFGQPRVGSKEFAASCDAKFSTIIAGSKAASLHHRWVNQEDIVPRSPTFLSGYCHSGDEWFFPSIGGLRFEPPLWLKLASDVYGAWLDYRHHELSLLANHALEGYAARLSGL